MHKNIRIDGTKIRDWASFHDLFSKTLGFPDFYGRNMDAWIDCMTSMDAPDDGMTSIHVAPGDVLALNIDGIADFKRTCPEVYDALIESTAFVNYRRLQQGLPPILTLAFAG